MPVGFHSFKVFTAFIRSMNAVFLSEDSHMAEDKLEVFRAPYISELQLANTDRMKLDIRFRP